MPTSEAMNIKEKLLRSKFDNFDLPLVKRINGKMKMVAKACLYKIKTRGLVPLTKVASEVRITPA